MLTTLLSGFGILLVYKLVHDYMLDRMLEDAKKPTKETNPEALKN